MLMLYLLALCFEYVVANESPEIVPGAFALNDEATECLKEVLSCNKYRTLLTAAPPLNQFFEDYLNLQMACEKLVRYGRCLNSDNVNNKCANMGELHAFIRKIIETRLFSERLCDTGSLSQYLYLTNAPCINYFIQNIKRMCRSMSNYDPTNPFINLDIMCRERELMRSCETMRLQDICGRDAVTIYNHVVNFNEETDIICYRISPEFLDLKNHFENDEFNESLARDQMLNKTFELNSSDRSNISDDNTDSCDESSRCQYMADLDIGEGIAQLPDEIRRRGEEINYCAEKNKKVPQTEFKNNLNQDKSEEILNCLLRLVKDQNNFFLKLESFFELLVRFLQANGLELAV